MLSSPHRDRLSFPLSSLLLLQSVKYGLERDLSSPLFHIPVAFVESLRS